jgi:hypothetical protein
MFVKETRERVADHFLLVGDVEIQGASPWPAAASAQSDLPSGGLWAYARGVINGEFEAIVRTIDPARKKGRQRSGQALAPHSRMFASASICRHDHPGQCGIEAVCDFGQADGQASKKGGKEP